MKEKREPHEPAAGAYPPGQRVLLPPGPRCTRCGHMPCPVCMTWCDTVLIDDVDEYEEEVALCCDGECDYPCGSLDTWQRQWPRMGGIADEVIVLEGPFYDPVRLSPGAAFGGED